MIKYFTILLTVMPFILNAQIWEENLLSQNPNATIEEKKIAFDSYREKVQYTKGNGYKPYARNLDFLLQRTSNGKDIPNGKLYTEWLKEKAKYENSKSNSNSNWIALGPINTPIILSNGKKRGNGRVNCIAFDPLDEDIIAFMTTNKEKLAKKNDKNCVIPSKYIDILTNSFTSYSEDFVIEYSKCLKN